MDGRFSFLRGTRAGLLVGGCVLGLTGCHSAYIEATVRNTGGGPVSVVEVDYPSASFGRTAVAAGSEFQYRFKVLGSGGTKVLWTDAQHRDHIVSGPVLREGDEGRMLVTIRNDGANLYFIRGSLEKGR